MSHPAGDRSPEQIADERVAGEISDVLLNMDYALDRARRALKTVRKVGTDSNAEHALGVLIGELERVRKRFLHDTVYAGDRLRLM